MGEDVSGGTAGKGSLHLYIPDAARVSQLLQQQQQQQQQTQQHLVHQFSSDSFGGGVC
jgi:hypothetical protein